MHAMIDCTSACLHLPRTCTISAGQVLFARLHTVRRKMPRRGYGRLKFSTGVMRNSANWHCCYANFGLPENYHVFALTD